MKIRRWPALILGVLCGVALPLAAAESTTGFSALRSGTSAHAQLAETLEKGNAYYHSLRGYDALFLKNEISGEKAKAEEEKIYLKFEKPFKIFMKWMNTKKKGLQVLYERGRHDGKLAVHKPGLFLGLAPVVFLDPKSPWVKEGSASYQIEDAGIGAFLEDFSRAVRTAQAENKLAVTWPEPQTADIRFNGSQQNPAYFAHRVRVRFDAKTSLPVKIELFDWNEKPMGIYEYRDIRVNPSTDERFNKAINPNLLKVYLGKK